MPRLIIQPLGYILQLFLNLLGFSGLYGIDCVPKLLKCPLVELISLQFLSLSGKRTLMAALTGSFNLLGKDTAVLVKGTCSLRGNLRNVSKEVSVRVKAPFQGRRAW